jgi:hypothetical protein
LDSEPLNQRIVGHSLLAFALIMLVSACDGGQVPATIIPIPLPTILLEATLSPFKSAIIGQVLTRKNGIQVFLANTPVRLASVHWSAQKTDGVFVLEGASSPGTTSQDDGTFIIGNIDPGDYVVVVGDALGLHAIYAAPSGKAKVFTAEQGKPLNIGQIEVTLGS